MQRPMDTLAATTGFVALFLILTPAAMAAEPPGGYDPNGIWTIATALTTPTDPGWSAITTGTAASTSTPTAPSGARCTPFLAARWWRL